jgi:flagellar biosynthesis/type III secretory pathway M-ring protein FliF/YscJ
MSSRKTLPILRWLTQHARQQRRREQPRLFCEQRERTLFSGVGNFFSSSTSSSSSKKEEDNKEEEESIDSIARRDGKFDFLHVAERLFEEEEEEDKKKKQTREDYTRRWEYHAWHLFLALAVPVGLSASVVSHVRRHPHPNLLLRKENEMKETRLKAEEAMTEQKKFETNVIEKARKENEGRYGKLAERMERLEREMEEEKKKKKKKKKSSDDGC